ALSLTDPSASTPTVPETAIVLPTRIARVKPISSSKGESAGTRWRPSCGSAIAHIPGAVYRFRHPHPPGCWPANLPGLRGFSTAGDLRDDHVVVVRDGHPFLAEIHRLCRTRRRPAEDVGTRRLATSEAGRRFRLLPDEELPVLGVAAAVNC